MGRVKTSLEQDLGPAVRLARVLEGRAWRIAWSPDGRLLAVGVESTVRLWDLATATWLGPLHEGSNVTRFLAWAPDSQRLALGLDGGEILLYDVGNRRLIKSLSSKALSIQAIAWAPDGLTIAACLFWRSPKPLLFWDLAADTIQSYELAGADCFWLAWSPCGTQVAVGTSTGHIALFDRQTGAFSKSLADHQPSITRLLWPTPDELISASVDLTIGRWRLAEGQARRPAALGSGSIGVAAPDWSHGWGAQPFQPRLPPNRPTAGCRRPWF